MDLLCVVWGIDVLNKVKKIHLLTIFTTNVASTGIYSPSKKYFANR